MRELAERDMEQLVTIGDILSIQLKDDHSANGGIAYIGETVGDFIRDTNLKLDDSISALNRELKLCGVCPIVFEDFEEIAQQKAEEETIMLDDRNIIRVEDNITVSDIMQMLENSDKLYFKAVNEVNEDIEGMFNTLIIKTPNIPDEQVSDKEQDYPLEPCITYIEGDKIDESKMIPISWLTEIGEI